MVSNNKRNIKINQIIMKKIFFVFVAFLSIALMVCSSNETMAQTTKKKVVPGEQAPPANPGQRNFGGMRPPTGGEQRPPTPRPRPEPEVRTISLDDMSMSDPFIYPDEKTKTYDIAAGESIQITSEL